MKSDVVEVSSREDHTELVLAEAEKTAAFAGLSHKGAMELRLLAEELMGMVRAITGEMNGDFWIETKGNTFELHLQGMTPMDFRKRRDLLKVSSSGKNDANRGFMGKIRGFFEPLEGMPLCYNLDPDSPTGEYSWSMHAYQKHLEQYVGDGEAWAREAWDELERSVIAHVADEVRVSIQGFEVELVVSKRLS